MLFWALGVDCGIVPDCLLDWRLSIRLIVSYITNLPSLRCHTSGAQVSHLLESPVFPAHVALTISESGRASFSSLCQLTKSLDFATLIFLPFDSVANEYHTP